MSAVDPRIVERIRGPAWADIRETLNELLEHLMAVGPGTRAELTTIYAKCLISNEPSAAVYAVVWLKTAKNVVVGFALPDGMADDSLTNAPAGMSYKGITKYFRLVPGEVLPVSLSEWARASYQSVITKTISDGI